MLEENYFNYNDVDFENLFIKIIIYLYLLKMKIHIFIFFEGSQVQWKITAGEVRQPTTTTKPTSCKI